MKNAPLTPAQLDALRRYAATYGRTWKSELRSDWMNACASVDPDIAGYLQQLRNSHGPSWLVSFKLAVTDDEPSRYKPEGAVLYDGTPDSGSIRRR